MFPCAHCGNQLPDGATFCNQCWHTVGSDDPVAATPSSGFTVPGPPPEAPTFESPGAAPGLTPLPYQVPEPPIAPPAPSPWDAPTTPPAPVDPTLAWGAAPPPVAGSWPAPPPPPGGGYGMGGYAPAPYGMPGYYGPPAVKTNGLAIASLVCSLASLVVCGLSAPVGVILGHIALSQIKRDGSSGRGMAIAGLVIGYVFIVLIAGFIVLAVTTDSSTS